jgi:hypothetical protein
MRRTTFGKLSVLAIGLLLGSFVLMGLSRLVVSAETARLVSAPTMLTAGALILVLTLQSVLTVSGIKPLED